MSTPIQPAPTQVPPAMVAVAIGVPDANGALDVIPNAVPPGNWLGLDGLRIGLDGQNLGLGN